MSPPPKPDRLRVAILGLSGEGSSWVAALAGNGAEICAAHSSEELFREGVDLGVAFVDPAAGAELTRSAAARQAPPLALLVGATPEQHPHERILRVLSTGKQDWER